MYKIETKIIDSREQCVQFLERITDGLIILHINICSINKHYEELLILVHEINDAPDVVICSETRQIDIQLYRLPGYTAYYNGGNINQNDGVITYVKSNLRNQIKIENIGEILVNKTTVHKNSVIYDIIGVISHQQ